MIDSGWDGNDVEPSIEARLSKLESKIDRILEILEENYPEDYETECGTCGELIFNGESHPMCAQD